MTRASLSEVLAAASVLALAACASDVARGQGAAEPESASLAEAKPPIPARPGAQRAWKRERKRDRAAAASKAPDVAPVEPDTGLVAATQAVTPDRAEPETGPVELPLAGPTPIEDPSGKALSAFHAALDRAAAGEGQARIAFYGASHVASDLFTGRIRQRLQDRFGDAGPGFVLPAKPWRWYHHSRFEFSRNRGFQDLRVKARAPRDDVYGLMGVALEASKRYAVSSIKPRRDPDPSVSGLFELWYLRQPKGGRVSVFIDGKRVQRIDTRLDHVEAGYASFETEGSMHRFELRAHADGPVRIFGVSLERPTPGVVLDTLGIPGSRARYHLHWEDGIYREHLARRQPDLVVLAYGTNESGDDDVPIETYEARVRKVLTRIKEVVPNASCLLIGPSDRPVRVEEGASTSYEPRPRTGELVRSQRKLSAEFGCGFFDLVTFMGGEMSMLRWVDADPPLGSPDHVHFTRLGYERLGDVLYDALLEGYTPKALPEVSQTPEAPQADPAHRSGG